MTSIDTRDRARAVKQHQLSRAEWVCSPEFLERHVRPHIDEGASFGAGTWSTTVIQLDGSGAATVRAELDGSRPVFAKLFPFDDGPDVYAKLQALRSSGLGAGERYQVVEPLAWIGEEKVLLCRGAQGYPLSDLLGADADVLAEGTAEAGHWLGRLHGSNLRIGRAHSLLVTGELASLAKRLAKVTAAHPGYVRQAMELLGRLDALAYDTVDGHLTQSHGQFRPIHVFLSPDVVTVIDLDRSAPADPARDVAEFLHRLRLGVYTATGDISRADRACTSFLAAYRTSSGGDEHLVNLRFHWARYVFHSLNGRVKAEESTYEDGGNAEFRLFVSEFDRIVSGRAEA
jgi:hypothetical protein